MYGDQLTISNFDLTPFIPGIGAGLLGYLIACYLLFLLAKKFKNKDANWAFIPFVNLFLFFDLAQVSALGGVIAMFIPILNIIVFLVAWSKILKRIKRSEWECLLLLIPFVNFVFAIYLILKLR